MSKRLHSSDFSHPLFFILISFIFFHSLQAQNGTWQTKTDMPTARASASAATVDGKIYVMGGIESGVAFGEPASAIIEIYYPETDSWDTGSAGPMPVGINSFTTAVVNNKIYIIGGQSAVGTTILSSVYEYDPQTGEWAVKTAMPEARAGLSSGVVSGKIYLVGGYNLIPPNSQNVVHIAEAWEYDPVADSWDSTKAAMNVPREYLTASVVDGRIYAFGGWNDAGTVFRTAERYDPQTDEWELLQDLPERRVYLKSAALNNKIYLFGGSTLHSVPPKTDTWEYNPVTDTYRDVTSMPIGIMHGTASVADDKAYWFGGFEGPLNFPGTTSARVFEYTPDKVIWVPLDQPTIQAGIDSSNDGDIVLVDEGTYYENINFKGKKITVASQYITDGDTSHISNTIIDGSQPTNPDSASVVYFVSGEDTNSVLSGFTITGGSGTSTNLSLLGNSSRGVLGGAILIVRSGAKIEKNRIIHNNVTATTPVDSGANGIAIGAYDGDFGDYLVIRDNLVSENSATSDWGIWGSVTIAMKETSVFERNVVSANVINAKHGFGGGLVLFGYEGWQGTYLVRNNIIRNNTVNGTVQSWAGGVYIANCSPEVTNNIITANRSRYGAGVVIRHVIQYSGFPNPVLINNTIINNSASEYGGGLEVGGTSQTMATVMNTIVWGNTAGIDAAQIDLYGEATLTMRYSDVQGGWSGEGNIDADPLFSDTDLYELPESSPCVGAGIDSLQISGTWYHAPPFDYDGDPRPNPVDNLVDMGAQESPFITGIIKENENNLPKSYSLEQNWPNPFNPITNIEYRISNIEFVNLSIYNLLGQKVATLVYKKQPAGTYTVQWNARDFASGVYLYKLKTEAGFVKVRKMVVLK